MLLVCGEHVRVRERERESSWMDVRHIYVGRKSHVLPNKICVIILYMICMNQFFFLVDRAVPGWSLDPLRLGLCKIKNILIIKAILWGVFGYIDTFSKKKKIRSILFKNKFTSLTGQSSKSDFLKIEILNFDFTEKPKFTITGLG